MKRVISLILAAAILALSLTVGAVNIAPKVKALDINYQCGDNITWSLDTATGVLRLDGTGETYTYPFYNAPWLNYRSYIKSIIFSEGITVLSGNLFQNLNKVVSISLPASLERILSSADFPLLETVSIPSNSLLHYVAYDFIGNSNPWYAAIPDNSPVYIGPVIRSFKGTPTENTTVEIKDGTTSICKNAFKGLANITDISFPNTLKYIGEAAFEGTGWYDSQPDGAVYAGSVFLAYKGTMQLADSDIIIKDGTKGIADKAFYDNGIINSVSIPASVEIIGRYAFYSCVNLTEAKTEAESCLKEIYEVAFDHTRIRDFFFPDSLKLIDTRAFGSTSLNNVYIPSETKLGKIVFADTSAMQKYEVSPDNPYYSTDSAGALFNKDKTVLINFPANSSLNEYTVPCGVKLISSLAFSYCKLNKLTLNDDLESTETNPFYCSSIYTINLGNGLQELSADMFVSPYMRTTRLTIPENIKSIESSSLGSCIMTFYFQTKDAVFNTDWRLSNKDATFFCYKYSTAYEFAYQNDITVVLLNDENIGDYSALEYAVNKAKSLAPGKTEHWGYWSIQSVIENIPWNIDASYQSAIDEMTNRINSIFSSMKITWSDYSDVDEAIARADAVDRDLYTSESLAELDAAVNSVQRYCDVADKDLIYEYVKNIDLAIQNLDDKIGDYSGMNEAISAAEGIDRIMYTDESLAALDEAVATAQNAGKTSEQSVINAYTQSILDALDKLEYKPADFSSLEDILKAADSVDRSLYTSESLAELDKAVAAVDYELTIDRQDRVSEWALQIETAIDNLEYLPADYSAVNAAVEKAEKLDRRYYSELSLIALDAAVNSVDYSLNITEQAKVNTFAQSIENALLSLDYAAVVLRHDPCGVIVSATAKEINPDSILTVSEVDSSEHEGTNFAVGGSIKSLHFYDIKLVLATQVVQPDGTVRVKIRLADGVDPAKCKVYHVTDDIVNPLVRFANTIDGNYVVFETEHFSEFAVIEVETVLNSIEISNPPERTYYGIGEQLDLTGLKVTANLSDGTSKEVDDFKVGMTALNSVGTKNVTVYYTFGGVTKTAEFEVLVSNYKLTADIVSGGNPVERINKKLGLFELYTKASVQLGCVTENAEGCSLRWSSDSSKVSVDESGKVTCKGLFGAKKAYITVEVIDAGGNVVGKDTVTVVFYKLSFQLSNAASQAVSIIKHSFFN
ncbi:MAG: leucine-rich repeat protein [Acutalibacteraceae bacterium]